VAIALALALGHGGPIARAYDGTATQPDIDRMTARLGKHPKLDSHLARLSAGDLSVAAEQLSRDTRVLVAGDLIEVEITAPNSWDANAALERSGARVVARSGSLVQAYVPLHRVGMLAGDRAIDRVRLPRRPEPDSVTGQQVHLSGANVWHSAGSLGAGVRVAIIDVGFAELGASQAAGDLPTNLTTRDFCGGGLHSASTHGTLVAEVVHEMAPSAELHLICISNSVNLRQAIDHAIAQRIDIVSQSLSWYNVGRGDGRSVGDSTIDGLVSRATLSGILWVNSAGNSGRLHWHGPWSDPDADGVLNFRRDDERTTFQLASGRSGCVWLKWDEWPATDQDFDLEVRDANTDALVAASTNLQDGSQEPTEDVCFRNDGPSARSLAVVVRKHRASRTPRLDIFVTGGATELTVREDRGSVSDPGTSPDVLAVGAVCFVNEQLEPFSARGPTVDGRTKPDLVAHDFISTGRLGESNRCGSATGFAGTSAAQPSVAGAAALLKSTAPHMAPSQLRAHLASRARASRRPRPDGDVGWGILSMGTLPYGLQPSFRETFPAPGTFSPASRGAAAAGSATRPTQRR
jgi:subtilisin family serine protease